MIYIDAQRAKCLSLWSLLPNDIKTSIETATEHGCRFAKIDKKHMTLDIQYALQELGYYVYHNRTINEYEIRW